MPIFCHCLHNSRYAISLYQLMVLPSSASSAWGGKFFRPERCILSDNTFKALRCIKNNGIILLVCDIDKRKYAIKALNTIIYVLLIQYIIAELHWSRMNAL